MHNVCYLANDQPLLEPLLEPLLFPSSHFADKLESHPVECLLCDNVFVEDEKLADVNEHLLSCHNLVVDKLQEIADLTKYAVRVIYLFKHCRLSGYLMCMSTYYTSDRSSV